MQSSSEEIHAWTTRRVVLTTVFVIGVFFTFWLLFRVRLAILMLFTAIVLGTAIRPGVEWLRQRGILRSIGAIVMFAVLLGVIIGFAALVIPLFADQAAQFSQNLPIYYSDFRNGLIGAANRLLHNIGLRMPGNLAVLIQSNAAGEPVLDQVGQTFLYARMIFKGLLEIIATLILAYYWTQESNLIIRTLLRFAPRQRRARLRDFLHLAEERLGGYLRGQGILCVAVGTAAFSAYLLIGLPFALVLGIIAGFFEMIPIFGPGLGAIPAALVALSLEPTKAIWVLVATMLIQMLENTLLVPNVMKNSIGVNPIIIILSMVGFGSVFGFLGTLLALPMAAIIQLVIDRIVLSPTDSNGRSGSQDFDVQTLINEGQEISQLVSKSSHDGGGIPGVPPQLQGEVSEITRQLDELLLQMKSEDEAAA